MYLCVFVFVYCALFLEEGTHNGAVNGKVSLYESRVPSAHATQFERKESDQNQSGVVYSIQ